jgi:hypothetical protein
MESIGESVQALALRMISTPAHGSYRAGNRSLSDIPFRDRRSIHEVFDEPECFLYGKFAIRESEKKRSFLPAGENFTEGKAVPSVVP